MTPALVPTRMSPPAHNPGLIATPVRRTRPTRSVAAVMLAVLTVSAAGAGGCGELLLRDLRCDLDAGQSVPAPLGSPDDRPVWEPQVRVRNETSILLHDVVVVINPALADRTAGYRFPLPEPLEPGANVRVPIHAFRNAAGKPFRNEDTAIISVRVETREGDKSFAGGTRHGMVNQWDILRK